MTARENLELIQSGYEAFGKGDIPAVLAAFSPDIAWHVPGRSMISGDYRGHDEVVGFFGKLQELSGGTFQLEIHDFLASDDHVVALVEGTAERNGRSHTFRGAHVWHVGGGKATEFWGTSLDQYADDQFWS